MSAEPDAAAGELVLATLYLGASTAREERLRRSAAALTEWDVALAALEAHGVLGLAARNLEQAGACLPERARRRLAARARAMQALEHVFAQRLERFLDAAGAAGVEVTLLKGASLALDLYPPGGLRMPGDLDLLVAARDLRAALGCARAIGLVPPPGAFPTWWYRLAHFHQKLVPGEGAWGELELHWHLHAPAHLYTVTAADLRARRRAVEFRGRPTFTLDPLDRLLHLATHLVRHCPLAGRGPNALRAWAAEPRAPLRVKWLLDLAAEIEHRHATFDVAALARRAREWNAERDLAEALGGLAAALDLEADARAWLERLRASLPAPHPRTPRSTHAERPLPGFDLRPSSLRALGGWAWPPRERFERLGTPGLPRALRRTVHATRVLAHASLVAGLTPVAWLGRSRRGRGATGHAPSAPPLELGATGRRVAADAAERDR